MEAKTLFKWEDSIHGNINISVRNIQMEFSQNGLFINIKIFLTLNAENIFKNI